MRLIVVFTNGDSYSYTPHTTEGAVALYHILVKHSTVREVQIFQDGTQLRLFPQTKVMFDSTFVSVKPDSPFKIDGRPELVEQFCKAIREDAL